MLTTLKQFPWISFLSGIFTFWVWTSSDCISPLNFLNSRTPPANAKADWDTLSGNQSPVKALGGMFAIIIQPHEPVSLSQSSHLVQVKLIDFDTVETVQPQTPKKAKVRISLSHQAGQNEPRINGGWYLTSDVFQFVTDMLHNEHTHLRRKLSCILRVAGCAWYGPVHCTRGQKQADEYRYKITPAKFTCSQSIWFHASNSNFCFVQRHMTGTTPLLRISLLWEWLDTGQMPRGSTKQQPIVMEWMEWLVSINVRLLTAKFPYKAEIFDDEATFWVLDRLSLMYHIQAETGHKLLYILRLVHSETPFRVGDSEIPWFRQVIIGLAHRRWRQGCYTCHMMKMAGDDDRFLRGVFSNLQLQHSNLQVSWRAVWDHQAPTCRRSVTS